MMVSLSLAACLLQASPDWTATGDGDFGRSLAVLDANGDGFGDLLVGSPDEAAARLFLGGPDGPSDAPSWTVVGSSRFGFRVARAGDVNGDGFEDAAVADQERTFVYLGSPAGLGTAPAWAVPGEVPAGVGDVNGDGVDDLAVGRPSFGLGETALYAGSAEGLAIVPFWRAVGEPLSGFGAAIAAAGDVDGDGFDDFAVGAPGHDQGVTTADLDLFYDDGAFDPADLPLGTTAIPDTGKAWLIAGGPGRPEAVPLWASAGAPLMRQAFGRALAGGEDLDGDGRPDLAVATARPDVAAFFSNGQSLSPAPSFNHLGANLDGAGRIATALGDVHGDGAADLVVADRTSLRVFRGPWLAETFAWSSTFGHGLAVGDLNGDGRDDIATGGEGRVRVIYGTAPAFPPPAGVPPPTAVAAAETGSDERSSSDGCGLLGAEALLALAYLSSRMRRARNQTSSP